MEVTNETILFAEETTFVGRNGTFRCTGINVLSRPDDIITVTPITSKGEIGNCAIIIPLAQASAFGKIFLSIAGVQSGGLWSVEDITGQADEQGIYITEERAREMLRTIEGKHDATLGITWETINCYLDDYRVDELPAILEKLIDEMPDEISSVTVYGEWNEGFKEDIDGYLVTIGDGHGKKDDEIFFHCEDKEDFKNLVRNGNGEDFRLTKFEY